MKMESDFPAAILLGLKRSRANPAWSATPARAAAKETFRSIRKELPPEISPGTGGAGEDLKRMEIRERLEGSFGGLSEVRREVLLLHDLEGWKHREIGEKLGIPDGTVRSHLHFARKHVRERMGVYYGNAPEGEES